MLGGKMGDPGRFCTPGCLTIELPHNRDAKSGNLAMRFPALVCCLAGVLVLNQVLAGAVGASAEPNLEAAEPAKNPFEGDHSRAVEGRSLFNQYCSHCHAPNALSPDPPKDLRRLKI